MTKVSVVFCQKTTLTDQIAGSEPMVAHPEIDMV
jgi:hypothetical protein